MNLYVKMGTGEYANVGQTISGVFRSKESMWMGHVERMHAERVTKTLLEGQPAGCRR